MSLRVGLLVVVALAGCDSSDDPPYRPEVLPSQREFAQDVQSAVPHAFQETAAPAEGAADLGPKVSIRGVTLTAPQGWKRGAGSMFVAAEFTFPRSEGDARDGRVTVSSAGSTVEENIKRWRGQFGGKPDKESQQELTIAGKKVVLIDYTGTYTDMRGGGPEPPTPDTRMIGAIVATEGNPVFVKAYGPSKTVAAHADEVQQFLRSMEAAGK